MVYNLGGVGWDVKHEIAIPNPFSTKTDDMIPSLLKFDAGASTALMIESVAHIVRIWPTSFQAIYFQICTFCYISSAFFVLDIVKAELP